MISKLPFAIVLGIITIVSGFHNIDPDGPFFPIEGTKFSIHCYVRETTKQLVSKIWFSDIYNIKYTNSSDGRIYITTSINAANTEANVTLTFDPILTTDITPPRQRSSCKYGETSGYQVTINVVPKQAVPTITVFPKDKFVVNKNKKATFSCKAKITPVKDKVLGVSIKWAYQVLSFRNNLPPFANVSTSYHNSSYAYSQVEVPNAQNNIKGTYFCVTVLSLTAGRTTGYEFYRTIEIMGVKYEQGMKFSKHESIVKAGTAAAQFNCDAHGLPIPIIKWLKNEDEIRASKKYLFKSSSKAESSNQLLVIKDVTYSDRGVYKCKVTFPADNITKVTKEFTLRVRDPLGALWPFLGIVVEVIALLIIIGLYELLKKKKHPKKDDDIDKTDHVNYKETSPLVRNSHKVSYTAGDDNVRARTSNDTQA